MSNPIRLNKVNWQDDKIKREERKDDRKFRDDRKKRRNKWREHRESV